MSVISDVEELAQKFSKDWGIVRRMISSHPLTAFWFAMFFGGLVGNLIGRL